MPSNSEMYERGVFDAEQDELNPFYYQHYYYYRRGYDDARRQLRRLGSPRPPGVALAVAVLVLAALAGGLWLVRGRAGSAADPAPEPPVAIQTQGSQPSPTRAPIPTTTATPAPTPPPVLGVAARARIVNLNGAPLRAREAPGLTRVVARIPEGSEVTIREGPVDADGYIWWRVESGSASGWVAERSPEGVAYLEPVSTGP